MGREFRARNLTLQESGRVEDCRKMAEAALESAGLPGDLTDKELLLLLVNEPPAAWRKLRK